MLVLDLRISEVEHPLRGTHAHFALLLTKLLVELLDSGSLGGSFSGLFALFDLSDFLFFLLFVWKLVVFELTSEVLDRPRRREKAPHFRICRLRVCGRLGQGLGSHF